MPVKRVHPPEARALAESGWKILDVRSVPEFEAGHPAGAYNIPLMHFEPGVGMTPNPSFLEQVSRVLSPSDRVVLSCKSGGRSLRAAEMLVAAGWQEVVDMRGGFDGERSPTGAAVVPGWRDESLPVETDAPGRTYAELTK